MAGSIVFIVLFVLGGGFPLFTIAWICSRSFQSAGWSGLVKVSSRWFSYSMYGSVMAVLSLSFLFGDAACRWIMSQIMAQGLGWRGVFFPSAASLGVLLLANLLFIPRSKRGGFWSLLIIRAEGVLWSMRSVGSLGVAK
jgi:sugar phosphate permease